METTDQRLTLTVREACRLLGIGETFGYQLTQRGQFPGMIRLGNGRGKIVISKVLLERFLEGKGNSNESCPAA